MAFKREVYWGKKDPFTTNYSNCVKMGPALEYTTVSKKKIEQKKARILYPVLQGEDLFDVMAKPAVIPTRDEKRFIARQLVDIVCDFHNAGIALKDLNPDSFFVTRNPGKPRQGHEQIGVVLLDFGSFEYAHETSTNRGTPMFMAPEYKQIFGYSSTRPRILLEDCVKRKGDVWSLAFLLCLFLQEEDPWKKYIAQTILGSNARREAEPPLPLKPPVDPINNMLWRMLEEDHRYRPDMHEVSRCFRANFSRIV